jgi:TolB protein
MTARGANIRSVTYGPGWEWAVGWTPDGRGITYVLNEGANLQIWVEEWDDSFDWGSPFLLKDPSPAYLELYSIIDFSWSPDGERLALETDFGAEVVNIDGTHLLEIMDRDNYYGSDAPSWSPDSRRIVFASDRDGNAEIYVSDYDGENLQRLTDNAADDFGPVWRPEQP